MRVKAACIAIALFIFFIGACIFVIMSGSEVVTTASDESNTDALHSQAEADNTEEDQIATQTEYYRIVQSDLLYYCYFYDQNHNIVKTEGPMSKSPHVETVDDALVRFTLQAGTGIGTQWGYFYDTHTGSFSDVFQSMFDQAGGRVAYSEVNKIVVRDIFDEAVYYKEFSDFSCPFAEVAEPFVEVHFVESDNYIEITYLSGPDYKEITEKFPL